MCYGVGVIEKVGEGFNGEKSMKRVIIMMCWAVWAIVSAAEPGEGVSRGESSMGRVVYIGDSLTHGVGAASYRWALHKILVDNGVNYEEIGVEQGNRLPAASVAPGTRYRGVPFFNRHCAMTSERAYEISGRKHISQRLDATDIQDWLGLDASYNGSRRLPAAPDMAFILIGTNDMLGDYDGRFHLPENWQKLKEALLDDEGGDMSEIVAALRRANPQVRIVVLPVLTWEYSELNNTPASYRAVADYNRALAAWAARKGLIFVDVNEVLTDVADETLRGRGVKGFFYEEPGMHLHPSWQGDLLIAGVVAKALGLHGRTAGVARELLADRAARLGDSVELAPGDAISSEQACAAVAVKASVGDGALNGWDKERGLELTLGDGSHAGRLRINESYIIWGDGRVLYSADMHRKAVAEEDVYVRWVEGGESQGIAAGYYVWLGDMLIGEALPEIGAPRRGMRVENRSGKRISLRWFLEE